MKVLIYRKCSTCMKALKWLDEHNISYEERAIKEENPPHIIKCFLLKIKGFQASYISVNKPQL